MKLYRFTLEIDQEIMTETEEEAWKIARDRVVNRYYGPTRENIEFLEDVPEKTAEESAGS